jgi:hypothetical protein
MPDYGKLLEYAKSKEAYKKRRKKPSLKRSLILKLPELIVLKVS